MKQLTNILKATIFLLVISGFTSVKAQQTISLEQLLNKKWHMYEKTDHELIEEYTKKTITYYFDNTLIGQEYYYLSDTPVLFFDMSKIGKIQKGKYFITKAKDSKTNSCGVFEICKLEGDTLILRNISQKHYIRYKVKK